MTVIIPPEKAIEGIICHGEFDRQAHFTIIFNEAFANVTLEELEPGIDSWEKLVEFAKAHHNGAIVQIVAH